jgi:putative ubiquitin-RnfH superfamily antitoxin RatB of RatAB toxin-antitoxin module
MDDHHLILIEVAYARKDKQVVLELQMPADTNIEQAIMASGILKQYAEINLDESEIGIFGKVYSKGQRLQTGDRVEIYRPLIHSPKDARRIRAEKQ